MAEEPTVYEKDEANNPEVSTSPQRYQQSQVDHLHNTLSNRFVSKVKAWDKEGDLLNLILNLRGVWLKTLLHSDLPESTIKQKYDINHRKERTEAELSVQRHCKSMDDIVKHIDREVNADDPYNATEIAGFLFDMATASEDLDSHLHVMVISFLEMLCAKVLLKCDMVLNRFEDVLKVLCSVYVFRADGLETLDVLDEIIELRNDERIAVTLGDHRAERCSDLAIISCFVNKIKAGAP